MWGKRFSIAGMSISESCFFFFLSASGVLRLQCSALGCAWVCSDCGVIEKTTFFSSRCSVLQCVAVFIQKREFVLRASRAMRCSELHSSAALVQCAAVLVQCAAVCCSVL